MKYGYIILREEPRFTNLIRETKRGVNEDPRTYEIEKVIIYDETWYSIGMAACEH